MSNNDKMFLEEITDIDQVDFAEEPKTEVEDVFGTLGKILDPGKSGTELLQELAQESENRLEDSQNICANCGADVEIGNSVITLFENGTGRLCRSCDREYNCDEDDRPIKEERDEDFDEPYGNLNN